jgi:hypothetical protein
MPLQLFMGILTLLTYLYEISAGACLGYLVLQILCLILQISGHNPPFKEGVGKFWEFSTTCAAVCDSEFMPTMRDAPGAGHHVLEQFQSKEQAKLHLG